MESMSITEAFGEFRTGILPMRSKSFCICDHFRPPKFDNLIIVRLLSDMVNLYVYSIAKPTKIGSWIESEVQDFFTFSNIKV